MLKELKTLLLINFTAMSDYGLLIHLENVTELNIMREIRVKNLEIFTEIFSRMKSLKKITFPIIVSNTQLMKSLGEIFK